MFEKAHEFAAVDAEDAFVVALDIQTAADLLNGVLF
jgi:hypothetical protein